MPPTTQDDKLLTRTRARPCENAEEMNAGGGRLVTTNAESHIALDDAPRFDCHHLRTRKRIHRALLDKAERRTTDIDVR